MEQYQDDELIFIQDLLHNTSEFIAYFELAETKIRVWQSDIEEKINQLQQQQTELQTLSAKFLERMQVHGEQTVQNMAQQFSQYDPQNIQLIAKDTLHQSNELLHRGYLGSVFLALITTIFTAFVVVLYLNGELPWEAHYKARNERQAGALFLNPRRAFFLKI